MRTEVYPSVVENGEAGARHIAAVLKEMYPNATVTYERGDIPQWGAGIETAPNFGKTEPGWRVVVCHP